MKKTKSRPSFSDILGQSEKGKQTSFFRTYQAGGGGGGGSRGKSAKRSTFSHIMDQNGVFVRG